MRRPPAGRWAESTHAEAAWGRSRSSTSRWSWIGALTGALIATICYLPATWLASALSAATQQRFVLADARGTVWSGSAVAVLTGGAGSRDASALPGRLAWTVQPQGLALSLRLSQACCLDDGTVVLLRPALGGFSLVLQPVSGRIGQWPSSWLAGLGTPWNTLRLGGTARLLSSGLALESAQGNWRLAGGINIELLGATSRLSTLETLGSYRLVVQGGPLQPRSALATVAAAPARLTLSTLEGALLLSGNGAWGPDGLHFRGEAIARDTGDPALANLLNIIGRRDGARSVISIG